MLNARLTIANWTGTEQIVVILIDKAHALVASLHYQKTHVTYTCRSQQAIFIEMD
jgi:hypothetical protein